LALLGGFSANEFYAYQANRKLAIKHFLSDYVPFFRRWEYRERLNDPNESLLLWNKVLTLYLLNKNKISCNQLHAICFQGNWYIVDKGLFRADESDVADALGAGEFVIKPACSRWGTGIRTLTIGNNKSDIKLDGENSDLEQVFNQLIDSSKSEPIMIVGRLYNHELINKLSRTSLNTVRANTCRTTTGEIRIFATIIRYASTESMIDNWNAGGYAAPINIETGKVGYPLQKKPTCELYIDENLEYTHPEVPYLPMWERAVSLAKEAHQLFLNMKTIGWDIAFTPNGPVITEGNHDWDMEFSQRIPNKGLLETNYREI
jgi:hypothetical protein